MALPSAINPINLIIDRQYNAKLTTKNQFFEERFANAKNLYRNDLLAHYGCVNAIEFSEDGEYLVSGGDDRRVLLWSLAKSLFGKGNPIQMNVCHTSNIFCLAFDSRRERIYSGGNDDQVLIHDIFSSNIIGPILHRKPVYSLSLHPQNNAIVATAGEDGRLLVFDTRDMYGHHIESQVLAKQKTAFHSVMFNPRKSMYLISANSDDGIVMWDSRKPKEEFLHYDKDAGKTNGISACFDSSGNRILALRRRLPPVLYNLYNEQAVCQFYHQHYYNSCTMKTGSFAGINDEYVLSGSDDFNLYMWKIPQDDAEWAQTHLILKGHRSIVNQIRYNKFNNLIASSGVEKMVKLWSGIPIGNWSGSYLTEHTESPRAIYNHQEYAELLGSGERISHDYSSQSTEEDAKMMAFFDSLIQREIEGWISDPETETSDSDLDDLCDDFVKFYPNQRTNGKMAAQHNRIVQLILKNRDRLGRMARNKASSIVQRKEEKKRIENEEKEKQRKLQDEDSNGGRYRKKYALRKRARYSKRLSQKCAENNENHESNNSLLLDTPSTSTGITNSNSSLYRVLDIDSDDDNENNHDEDDEEATVENHRSDSDEHNLVNILPTPLNGTQEYVFNNLELSMQAPSSILTNSRRNLRSIVAIGRGRSGIRRRAVANDADYNANRASTSRGRAGNGSNNETTRMTTRSRARNLRNRAEKTVTTYTAPSIPSTSQSFEDYYSEDSTTTTTSSNNNYNNTISSTSSDSDYECDYRTPPKRRRTSHQSDSGCGSSSKMTNERAQQRHRNDDSDEDRRKEKFRKRAKKVKMNLRKRTCADSDS